MMTKFCVLLIRSLWLRVVKDGTNVFCILGLLGDHVSRKPVIGRAKWKCSVADVASFAMTSSWKIVTYIDILTRFTPAEAIHFACPHLCAAMCRHFLLRHKLHRLICLCRYSKTGEHYMPLKLSAVPFLLVCCTQILFLSYKIYVVRICNWIDRVRNAMLHKVNEDRNIQHKLKRRKANWIGHILRRNCLKNMLLKGR